MVCRKLLLITKHVSRRMTYVLVLIDINHLDPSYKAQPQHHVGVFLILI